MAALACFSAGLHGSETTWHASRLRCNLSLLDMGRGCAVLRVAKPFTGLECAFAQVRKQPEPGPLYRMCRQWVQNEPDIEPEPMPGPGVSPLHESDRFLRQVPTARTLCPESRTYSNSY